MHLLKAPLLALILGVLAFLPALVAHADNGGIGFWLPGQFGALTAVPTEPGWSLPLIYYLPTPRMTPANRFPEAD